MKTLSVTSRESGRHPGALQDVVDDADDVGGEHLAHREVYRHRHDAVTLPLDQLLAACRALSADRADQP
jgi:hypothetical protein